MKWLATIRPLGFLPLALFAIALIGCNHEPSYRHQMTQLQPFIEAVERFHDEHGRYPNEMSELVGLEKETTMPRSYSCADGNFSFTVFAGGYKDCLLYENSETEGGVWYYCDDSGAEPRKLASRHRE